MGLFRVATTLPHNDRYVGRARRHYAAAALRPPKPLRAALSAPLARGPSALYVGPPPPCLRPGRLPSLFAVVIPHSFRYLRPRSRESGARRLSAAGALFIFGRARRNYAAAALRPPKPLRAAAALSLRGLGAGNRPSGGPPPPSLLRFRYAAALSGER